jgi:hypothetical protein
MAGVVEKVDELSIGVEPIVVRPVEPNMLDLPASGMKGDEAGSSN